MINISDIRQHSGRGQVLPDIKMPWQGAVIKKIV
jgi:hypothetical protein